MDITVTDFRPYFYGIFLRVFSNLSTLDNSELSVDLKIQAIKWYKKLGRKSVTVMSIYGHYRSRFWGSRFFKTKIFFFKKFFEKKNFHFQIFLPSKSVTVMSIYGHYRSKFSTLLLCHFIAGIFDSISIWQQWALGRFENTGHKMV